MTDETPESGADKFRDNWVPTPFLTKVYDAAAKTYTMEFKLPKQLLLQKPSKFLGVPDWKALVHDEVLRYADRDGLILEGQIMMEERDADSEPAPEDPTIERDASVQQVIADPSLEEKVAEEQAELPVKMSKAELEFRQRLRQNVRDTEEQAFGFVQGQIEGKPLPGGHEMKIDRKAFQEGFLGIGARSTESKSVDMMIVKCEAMVSMSLGVLDSEPLVGPDDLDIEIPDDLSGLDDSDD